MNYKKHLLIY